MQNEQKNIEQQYREFAEQYMPPVPDPGWDALEARLDALKAAGSKAAPAHRRLLPLFFLAGMLLPTVFAVVLRQPLYKQSAKLPSSAATASAGLPARKQAAGTSPVKPATAQAAVPEMPRHAACGGRALAGAGKNSAQDRAKAGVVTSMAGNRQKFPLGGGETAPMVEAPYPRFPVLRTATIRVHDTGVVKIQKTAGGGAFPPLPVLVRTRPGPKFYYRVAAGPDISMFKFQGFKHYGGSVGVFLGYHARKNASVETGLLYTTKDYYSSGDNFKGIPVPPPGPARLTEVNDAAHFIEMPATVKLNFKERRRLSFFVNCGMSSYFGLGERYVFSYSGPGAAPEQHTTADASRTSLFSIIHISGGCRWRIGGADASLEPYCKLPVTGIGCSRLRIVSSGIYFSITPRF